MVKYVCLFLLAVLISSFSQILLKKSAGTVYKSRIYEYLNVKVIVAYGMFFLSTLLTLFAYKVLPLSMGPILEASGYIWVTVLSRLFIGEKVAKRKVVGLITILIGIVVFSI